MDGRRENSQVLLLLQLGLVILLSAIQQNIVVEANSRREKRAASASHGVFNNRKYCSSGRHIHMAVGPDAATSMMISFSSFPCRKSADEGVGGILVGRSKDELTRLVLQEGAPVSYTATLPPRGRRRNQTVEERLYESERYHHVLVENLEPATRYYFKCVVMDSEGNEEDNRIYEEEKDDHNDEGDQIDEGEDPEDEDGAPEVEEDKEEGEQEQEPKNQENYEEEEEDGDEEEGGEIDQFEEEEEEEEDQDQKEEDHYDAFAHVTFEDLQAIEEKLRQGGRPEGESEELEDKDERRWRRQLKKKTDDDDENPSTKNVYSFFTAPSRGDLNGSARGSGTVKMAVIGDVGRTDHALEMIQQLDDHGQDIDFIILAGDIAYANQNHLHWDNWMSTMMDGYGLFRRHPLMIAAGNHDAEWDESTGRVFVSYETRFRMPQIQEVVMQPHDVELDMSLVDYPLVYEYGNSYYSFDYGPSHNIVLNPFVAMEPSSHQYKWLAKDLQSINRTVTPWVTVTTHCPLYNTFVIHQDEPQSVLARQYLEPLFVQYSVNFVWSGHVHAYMRSRPVIQNVVDPKGPVYLILGNGGRNANAPYLNNVTTEEWVAEREHSTYGYGTLEFVNASHAFYEWVQTGVSTVNDSKLYYFPRQNVLDERVWFENQFLY